MAKADVQAAPVPLESSRMLDYGTRVSEISLDGDWETGIDRHYNKVSRVPGLVTDPTQATRGTLWYRRTVEIPVGTWTRATLTLKGARFAPQVYLNGELVSSVEGGMAATIHRFALPAGVIGKQVTLEIALKSLKNLDPHDASAVPGADLWRNNNSSYLWDSVVLRLHGEGELERITPTCDLNADSVSLKWDLVNPATPKSTVNFKILDENDKVLVSGAAPVGESKSGTADIDLQHRVESWSPEHPHLYRLRTELIADGNVLDAREQSFGQRQFKVDGLGFQFNGHPYHFRMGTFVWHRWSRDPEAKEIAFDPVWFENNIVLPLKDLGGNAMRFHLGLPPEKFLDLCDRDGLAVQMEWPFFHGINASPESMRTQWTSWLDTAMRHPSVVIVHPWNETEGAQLKLARSVLYPLLEQYPPLVVAHRDLTPVHKYWWSLFENLGLYYDSAAQFGTAVMADEFGGNYLDGNGNPGGYPATHETFLRFLGRNNTKEERLELQAESNARVAEYWRRLGVAGFSPFCIIGSPQDGSHWFLGPTNVPHPEQKPVWSALSAAFAPCSVSLEIWNRNFQPGETVNIPLWFFNDTDEDRSMTSSVHIVDRATRKDGVAPLPFIENLKAHSSQVINIDVAMPTSVGEWTIEAKLAGSSSVSKVPVVSAWNIRTFVPEVPAKLQTVPIGVPVEEVELRQMLIQLNLHVVDPSDPGAKVVIAGHSTWKKLSADPSSVAAFDTQLHQGKSIVLLDAGPQPLGVGYSAGNKLGGPLESAPSVNNPGVLETATLFGGVKVSFAEVAEPESTIQEAAENKDLWQHIPREATWLWNGLRGGLIVPAADMQVSGLSGKAILSVWQARGADPSQIPGGSYFAYELAGYYAFARTADDKNVSAQLRKRVKFLVEDAPALESVINPNAPINVTDLGALYAQGNGGQAESLTPLANAGKNLSRTPVVKIGFGPGAGSVIVSQLLTAGRLLPGHAEKGPGVYGLRYDPVAVQFVLNMLDSAMTGH